MVNQVTKLPNLCPLIILASYHWILLVIFLYNSGNCSTRYFVCHPLVVCAVYRQTAMLGNVGNVYGIKFEFVMFMV